MSKIGCIRSTALAVTVFIVSTVFAASPGISEYPEVVGDDLRWQFDAAHGGAQLRVVRPDGKVFAQSVPAGEQNIAFGMAEDDQPEGIYLWEISLAPLLTEDTRSELQQARREGAQIAIAEDLQGQRLQGSFRVVDGRVYGVSGSPSKGAGSVERADDGEYSLQAAPVTGDLTVRSSLCVGGDCDDNENYSFDTLRMKEDNLRISFLDVSTTTGYPAGDWQLRINESTSGGADFFAVDWLGTVSTGGANNSPVSSPLRIDGGAPSDALRIASSGNIGLGTPGPDQKLHLRDGDSPALRLEQDESNGFQAQTWDVAGNEANFFVRDVTNGNELPFRVLPGALKNALVVGGNSSIGIGTDMPQARLHVMGDARVEGALYQLSSRAAKTGFDRLGASELLEKIGKLNLGFWRYKSQSTDDRHFGPTAEDFYAAFGLGGDERHISVSDMAGIALGATQALQEEIHRRDETIAELTRRLERLEAAIDVAPVR